MGSTNVTSARIIGGLTILVGVMMLDTHGFLSGTIVAAAGSILLFGATSRNTRGLNIRTIGMTASYLFLVIIGLGLSTTA